MRHVAQLGMVKRYSRRAGNRGRGRNAGVPGRDRLMTMGVNSHEAR